jgi:dipeptidyl aminopeptidase/acylaminoacyl peptidase
MVADVRPGGPVAEDARNSPITAAATSGHAPVDPILRNPGGIGLQWAADNALIYMSYVDGFPHLYSIQHPGRSDKSGQPTLLTPGPFMVEQVALTPDRRFAVYNANTGGEPNDLDRRHLFKVPVTGATAPAPLTTGAGIEWSPTLTADGQTVAFLSSGAQRRRLHPLCRFGRSSARNHASLLPADFPALRLVTPRLVSFRASDGVDVHGQLFEPADAGNHDLPGASPPSFTSTAADLGRCCPDGTTRWA